MKILPLYLIFLVLSLPVVSAASISGYTFGQDNVRGVGRQTDEVTLITEIGGVSNVNANEVFYKSISGRQEFDNCVDNLCSLTLNEKTFNSEEQKFTVEFRGVDRVERDLSLIPDSRPARVVSVSADKDIVGPEESITFSVSATDDACSGTGCQNECSGISTIDIYSDSELLDNIGVYGSSCSIDISKTFKVSDLTDRTGSVIFTFKAVDNVLNPPDYSYSVIVNIDASPPTPVTNTFNLIKDGENIEFYSSPANVRFLMDAVEGTVYADLSSLGGNGVYLNCDQTECFTDFNLRLNGDGNERLTVPVTLTDSFGNVETYDLDKTVFIDTVGPEVSDVFLGTGEVNGVSAFSSETQPILFLDDDVGFNNGNIFLDYSQVNPSLSSVKATSCNATACSFPKVPITLQGEKTIFLSLNSKDDLNNQVTTPFSFNVITDIVPPLIIDVPFVGFEGIDVNDTRDLTVDLEQYSRGSTRSSSSRSSGSSNINVDDLGIPTIGSTLIVQTVISENQNVVAYGNFSAINDEVQFGSCEGGVDVNNWDVNVLGVSHSVRVNEGLTPIVCTFEVEVTKSGNIIGKEAEIFFQDVSGNYDSQRIDIPNVYGIIGLSDPNYWSSKVTCSPSSLDREVGELIEQDVFCTVSLTPLTDQLQTINSIELNDCSGDFLKNSELGNAPSFNPYVKLTFDKDQYNVNEVNVTCSLDISTMLEYDIVTNMERENVTINLGLFNNPYDLPDEAIINEIKEVNEQYNGGMWKMIGTIETISKIAAGICTAINTLNTISQLMSAVSAKIPTPAGGPARIKSSMFLIGNENFKRFSEKFCAFVTCRVFKENGESKSGTLAPWSNKLFSGLDIGGLASKFTSLDKTNVVGDPSQYLDVKNNIYLSALTLCIPGIISNMEKYRQIQCYYGYCLQDVSVDNSLPPSACEQQKAYMTCKFFVSPLFSMFPILALFNHVMDLIQNILKDPFVAMGMVLNYYCATPPVAASGTAWSLCEVTRVVNMGTDIYSSFLNIVDSFDKNKNQDYCKLLDSSDRSPSRYSGGRGPTRS